MGTSTTRGDVALSRRQLLLGTVGAGAALAGADVAASAVSAAPAAAAARNRVEGHQLYSYGHSYTVLPSPYVGRPGYDEYQLVLGRLLGASQVVSRGRSGTPLVDTISAMIAPTFGGHRGRQWEVGTGNGTKTVLWHNMMNDVSSTIGGSRAYLAGYDAALRLGLGVLGSRALLHSDHPYRTTGAWTRYRTPLVAGGAVAHTRTYSGTMSFVVAGDSCHIATLSTTTTNPHGTFRVEVDGKNTGIYFNGTGRTVVRHDTITGATREWLPAGVRVTGMNRLAGTSGSKVLTIRRTEPKGSTRPVFVNGVYLTSSTPPSVYVGLEPPRNPAAMDGGNIRAFYANEPAYRALITRACSEYSYAHAVDLAPGWDNRTMVSVNDSRYFFHPNELGMQCLAENFAEAILGG